MAPAISISFLSTIAFIILLPILPAAPVTITLTTYYSIYIVFRSGILPDHHLANKSICIQYLAKLFVIPFCHLTEGESHLFSAFSYHGERCLYRYGVCLNKKYLMQIKEVIVNIPRSLYLPINKCIPHISHLFGEYICSDRYHTFSACSKYREINGIFTG